MYTGINKQRRNKMLYTLKITYRFFVLQRKTKRYTLDKDSVEFNKVGVQKLNELVERLSRI